jgi:hypothetical protein
MPPEPRLISAQDLTVKADFGQIYIYSTLEGEAGDELVALDDAIESGRFVGVRPGFTGFIDLLTPGQWNFHTPLRLEVWSAEPPDDRGDWDHEVDADFDVPDGQMSFMQSGVGTPDCVVDIPAGTYRVRVSGRGYTALGHAGADGDDSYRLRLWPRDQDKTPILRKRWQGWDRYR